MCHVLIIEDDPLLAMELEGVFSDNGATSFSIAHTASLAVSKAIATPPKLIASDVRLETGTGPQAVQEIIFRLGQIIPTIFITGTPDECSPCDPPHRVLEKPFVHHELISAFRELAFAE